MARQVAITIAMVRTRRWLRRPPPDPPITGRPLFFLVVPVLREAAGLAATVDHLRTVAAGHQVRIVVVTSARERAEAHRHPEAADTIAVAQRLATMAGVTHLHHPDPQAVKADQLNLAADWCLSALDGQSPTDVFLVVYDADSRPPADSLDHFTRAVAAHPNAGVFHQSSRFVVRPSARSATVLRRVLVAGGAVRASRFVLAYEIPRLRNRLHRARWRRWLAAGVYSHVTGHGMCLRLSLVAGLPLPARSPLEDMHYSFLLCSRREAMVPVASLDVAEVPASLSTQFGQLTRWVAGPARLRRYLADPATRRGLLARVLACSAAGITAGWLSCAVLPAVLLGLLAAGDAVSRLLVAAMLFVCLMQLLLVNDAWGRHAAGPGRLAGLVAYPVVCTVFGVAGLVGVLRLWRGGDGAGKTERR
ncbi:MAG: hypothetical protein JXA67_12180 [Micromonosporaceae bacterium]|nr:hypothetical protein [Micromonosporaceae bacterium]